ncbi:hypothetical protein P5673_017436 [Acropora cervicornis]|uniref:Uncharacterized protein n=1 Tax=Acropora cervicornis TaxID=6130 RepID=A0AAD9QEN3_ACRCE|nr:hypothetical protein P5673_017436 [Acropora cervicornis]
MFFSLLGLSDDGILPASSASAILRERKGKKVKTSLLNGCSWKYGRWRKEKIPLYAFYEELFVIVIKFLLPKHLLHRSHFARKASTAFASFFQTSQNLEHSCSFALCPPAYQCSSCCQVSNEGEKILLLILQVFSPRRLDQTVFGKPRCFVAVRCVENERQN